MKLEAPNTSTLNQFYPFYTQWVNGTKKYGQTIQSWIHISESEYITLSITKEKKEYLKLEIDRNNSRENQDKHLSHKDTKYIAYQTFAAQVRLCYSLIQRCVDRLSESQAYLHKEIMSAHHSAHNHECELDVTWSSIKLNLNPERLKFSIKEGKKVNDTETRYTEGEAGYITQCWGDGFNEYQHYTPIKTEELHKTITYFWDSVLRYFKAPKTLRAKEYSPA